MIHATCKRLDDTFHLQLEEQGSQLSDRDTGFYTEDVQLQISGMLQQTDECGVRRGKVWKESYHDAIGSNTMWQ